MLQTKGWQLKMNTNSRKETRGDFEVGIAILDSHRANRRQVLEKAAEQIKEQLKNEEKFPDLRDRLIINSTNASQQYFLEPYQNECGSMVISLFNSLQLLFSLQLISISFFSFFDSWNTKDSFQFLL